MGNGKILRLAIVATPLVVAQIHHNDPSYDASHGPSHFDFEREQPHWPSVVPTRAISGTSTSTFTRTN
jgi:hypothetical protein